MLWPETTKTLIRLLYSQYSNSSNDILIYHQMNHHIVTRYPYIFNLTIHDTFSYT
jgi:hypothetical protein